jgi:hypothetical protein
MEVALHAHGRQAVGSWRNVTPRPVGRGLATLALFATLALPVCADEQRIAKVGRAAHIDQLVLPGPELEVKPLGDRQAPVVLRITSVKPHGTAFRYDLVYYGLEAGTFDLKNYLRRKDASAVAELPSIPVTIESVLPSGQVRPNALPLHGSPWLGGYRLTLIVGGILWGAGLFAIVFARRRRHRATVAASRPLTMADRLRPLVERAMAGTLDRGEQAELERTLLAYWRRRLALHETKPAETFRVLRDHADAGPLLVKLEEWLHRPGDAQPTDLTTILAPYRTVPAEEA